MNKIIYTTVWFILLSAMVTIGLIIFWLSYPYKPVEFKDGPFKVKTLEVKVGGHVEYEVNVCKNVDYGGKISRTFIDGVIYTTPDIETNMEKGCSDRIISVYIPRALPEGTYTIKTNYHYQVNPIRTVDVVTYTEQFKIVK